MIATATRFGFGLSSRAASFLFWSIDLQIVSSLRKRAFIHTSFLLSLSFLISLYHIMLLWPPFARTPDSSEIFCLAFPPFVQKTLHAPRPTILIILASISNTISWWASSSATFWMWLFIEVLCAGLGSERLGTRQTLDHRYIYIYEKLVQHDINVHLSLMRVRQDRPSAWRCSGADQMDWRSWARAQQDPSSDEARPAPHPTSQNFQVQWWSRPKIHHHHHQAADGQYKFSTQEIKIIPKFDYETYDIVYK